MNVTVIRFTPAEPPAKAPEYPEAAELGVMACLRAEKFGAKWCCGHCWRQQRAQTFGAFVPEGVDLADSAGSIRETARLTAYNGSTIAWCLPCARRLGRPTPTLLQLAGNGPVLAAAVAALVSVGLLIMTWVFR